MQLIPASQFALFRLGKGWGRGGVGKGIERGIMKKLLVLLLCLFIIGCKQKSVKTQTEEEKAGLEITNMLSEDIKLIGVK